MQLEDLPVVELTGSPYERGVIHGETLRQQIKDCVFGWEYMVEKVTGESVQDVVDEFHRETRFNQVIQQWVPGLLDELKGIAEGANLPLDRLTMFNWTDENDWFLEYRGYGLEMPEARGCSSFGVADGDINCIGQNMDIPGATDGFQVLLHIKEAEKETYVFTLAGLLGMIGLSSAPVGLVNNSLKQLNQRTDGLPVTAMVRGILAQPDYDSAVKFITTAPHATGHNYILGNEKAVAMFECSANQVKQMDGARLVHSNHPLANDDVNADERLNRSRSTSNTYSRLEDMSRSIEHDKTLDVDAMKAALSSHRDEGDPVCRHVTDRKTNFSAGAVVYEMGESTRFHFAPGPPCETEFGCWEFG